MSNGIKRIDAIKNLAVFQDFEWAGSVKEKDGKVSDFKVINILYGRNYSGKTTLSRIVRAMEAGQLSDKYETPSFSVSFAGGANATERRLEDHGEKIRVFNEDFVKDNLRFITNPEDSIESFAILGDDNNKIEKQIEALEAELGSQEEGKETGLYASLKNAKSDLFSANEEKKKAGGALEKQLGDKATDRKIGIKYNSERFGDQNYNIQKLKVDINKVTAAPYQPPTDDELKHHENLILEKKLGTIPPFTPSSLNLSKLSDETENLVSKSISASDKIEELVKDAVLHRWVNDGRGLHKGKRENCAFCDNKISESRWKDLNKHFDEESDRLESDINKAIARIELEKEKASSTLSIVKSRFYSTFHERLDKLENTLEIAIGKYSEALDALIAQLSDRKDNILNPISFVRPDDTAGILQAVWDEYGDIRAESDAFTDKLNSEQSKSREFLRLKEISDYLITIQYEEKVASIEALKLVYDSAVQEKIRVEGDVREKEALITSKKRELNDEEKGAKKVNEYLNHFFGHQFLSLEAKKEEIEGEGSKRIRFEVVRGGKKAYHLSEGECSLLAFCYFLAKLGDVDTKDSKPIIWIDDPISSLDGNHIFFVYSLINAEIVSSERFKQLFISTHNLDFLKYLKRLSGKFFDTTDGKQKAYQKAYFVVVRQDKVSTIEVMPKYLKEYVTEFNYLFHQIYKCAEIGSIDDTNYTTFYNFGNNARKFFEVYLYYKYPDQGMTDETLRIFFGKERIPAVLTDRINNEYSHLCGLFERGSAPVEVPEMQAAARQIIQRLKEDNGQYTALLKSVGVNEEPHEEHV